MPPVPANQHLNPWPCFCLSSKSTKKQGLYRDTKPGHKAIIRFATLDSQQALYFIGGWLVQNRRRLLLKSGKMRLFDNQILEQHFANRGKNRWSHMIITLLSPAGKQRSDSGGRVRKSSATQTFHPHQPSEQGRKRSDMLAIKWAGQH